MKLDISYSGLNLVQYEGAGNKTPVLDLSNVLDIERYSPHEVRSYLENDIRFREWLRTEGKRIHADTVMIFYERRSSEYDFVTFIGEPNADVSSPFSTMCGNGIRCLALHVFLVEQDAVLKDRFLLSGIRIWAEGIKTVRIDSIESENDSATVRVEMGPFHHTQEKLQKYTNGYFHNIRNFDSLLLPANRMPESLEKFHFGIGFNGEDDGEPHLVLLMRWDEYGELLNELDIESSFRSHSDILTSLRTVACRLGQTLTFAEDLFPEGINVNVGVVLYDEIFMSTHERNLSESEYDCTTSQVQNGFCSCNTLACGTGGAAVSNIARLQGFVDSDQIRTHHPGGQIEYLLQKDQTVMLGPARRVDSALESASFNSGVKHL